MGPSKDPSTPGENQALRSAMRAAIPTGASADPLLQPGVSHRRSEMAGVEGATALSPIGSW